MNNPTDVQLVQGVLRSDAASEAALYRRFSAAMFRVCLRYAANRHEAEDMLQEGFMLVYADLPEYRGEGSLEGWIRRVMVRAALRWLRQRRSFDLLDDQIETQYGGLAEPADPADWNGDESKQVTFLLQKLPPGYRTVLNLYAIEGYNHEEIAALLGIHVGTSRSQLSKARAMMRKMLRASATVQPLETEK